MASICVFVIVFSAIIEIIPKNAALYVSGILEVTRGCKETTALGERMLPLISSIISWGGLSVHFQANALCKGKLSLKKYYQGKILSALISFILTQLFFGDIYVSIAVITVATAVISSVWLIYRLMIKLPVQPEYHRWRHS